MKNTEFSKFLLWIQLLFIILLGALAAIRDMHLSEVEVSSRVLLFTSEAVLSTQELVKLELGRAKDDVERADSIRKEISIMMNDLYHGNAAMNLEQLDDKSYREEFSRLYMQWKKLDSLIENSRKFPENNMHLFMLSGEYYLQAKNTIIATEKYSTELIQRVKVEKFIGFALLGMIAVVSAYILRFSFGKTKDSSS